MAFHFSGKAKPISQMDRLGRLVYNYIVPALDIPIPDEGDSYVVE
jgi:hypothetical protein